VKLMSAYETSVYTDDDGYICIGQPDPCGNAPHLIMLTPTQAAAVAKALSAESQDRDDEVKE